MTDRLILAAAELQRRARLVRWVETKSRAAGGGATMRDDK
jgi:hypothetical protein